MRPMVIMQKVAETNLDPHSLGEVTGQTGRLIVNADDWGRNRETTDRTLDCVRCGAVSSVSAMVFMEDSERAAAIALGHGIDAGLHLNFTSSFSRPGIPARLVAHQSRLSKYLLRNRFAKVMFHPGLTQSFEYVIAAQIDEFARLFGRKPDRLDGHHHMHLCANVLLASLLPAGTIVRRNFSFRAGEKSWMNRSYRAGVDRILSRRHRLTDFLFALPAFMQKGRINEVFSIAQRSVVELETHPINPQEFRYLTEGELRRRTGDFQFVRNYRDSAQAVAITSAEDTSRKQS